MSVESSTTFLVLIRLLHLYLLVRTWDFHKSIKEVAIHLAEKCQASFPLHLGTQENTPGATSGLPGSQLVL